MAIPNHSEKSVALDREENITKGNLSAKKVVLYTYDPNNDTLVSGASGFSPHANITTDTEAGVAQKATTGQTVFAIARAAYTTDNSLGLIDCNIIYPRVI